jgi:hypothetical protein
MRHSESIAVPAILRSQNQDGGWGYQGGSSWTEPTVYALLTLAILRRYDSSFARGLEWLRVHQRKDGGWPPNPSVDESTWVTSLALMAASGRPGGGDCGAAVEWLLRQSGRETSLAQRARAWMLDPRKDLTDESGWPWYPNAAAWVMPTSLGILALARVQRLNPTAKVKDRIESARPYLLERVCRDGGWNYGASQALGYQAESYPETTGVALLGLYGVQSPILNRAFAAAQRHLRLCRSVQGQCWLKLGLLAHGQLVSGAPAPSVCRTIPDRALLVLADAAEDGSNILLA